MELVGIPGVRCRLAADAVDGVGVEPPQVPGALRQPSSQRHRPGAPLLEGRVVEEGVGLAVQDLVGERRGLGGLPEVGPHVACAQRRQERSQAVHVRGLGETVPDRLLHDRVVGDLDRPRDVLLAGGEPREERGHQVVGLHAL